MRSISRRPTARDTSTGIHKRGRTAAAPLALALAVATVAACSSSSSRGNSPSSTSSGSAASFFAGKTITFISPDAAGGTYDLYARLFAPALGSILHATVNVEDVPGGGTIVGTDQLVSSNPNGLTIGDVNVAGDIGDRLQGTTALKANLNTLSWIGQPTQQVEVWLAPEGANISSWSQVVKSKSTVSYGGSKSGVGWLLGATSMHAWSIPTKFETGYPTLVALSQGVIANEFTVTEDDLSGDFYSDILGKKARPLMVSVVPSLASQKAAVAGVPTVAQEIAATGLSGAKAKALEEADSLAEMGFDFAAPPGLSAAKLTVLRNAFMEAAQDVSTKAQAQKENLQLQPTNGASVATEVTSAEAAATILTPYLK
jgi:tripartite-type tricarboxylate transporter receptor subunit TctC